MMSGEADDDQEPSPPTLALPVLLGADAGIVAFDRLGADATPPGSLGEETNVEAEPAAERGTLVFDADLVQPICGTVVIGRQPDHDPRVAAGMAVGLAIDDRALMLSRVHAELATDGSDVVLLDRGSVNGTFSRPPGGHWRRLEPEIPELVADGTELRFGALEARFVASTPPP